MPKISLIRSYELEALLAKAGRAKMESIDFRSFYYQIEIGIETRPFFRVYINNVLYQLKVLPMGASFSCYCAQQISLACAQILRKPSDLPPAVYIDNLFFFPNSDVEVTGKRSIPPHLPEVGDHDLDWKIPILGRIIDVRDKSVSLSTHCIEKIRSLNKRWNSDRMWTTREFFQLWGNIFFATDVLHANLSDTQKALRWLSESCFNFVKGQLELDAPLPDWSKKRDCLGPLLHASRWERSITIPPFNFFNSTPTICYTDASNIAGGSVTIGRGRILIDSFPFPPTCLHINEREAFAGAHGLTRCVDELAAEQIKWFTDSKVVYYAALKGRSRNTSINASIQRILALKCWIGVEWIPSDQNLADAPSRNKTATVPETIHNHEQQLQWDSLLRFSNHWKTTGFTTSSPPQEQQA